MTYLYDVRPATPADARFLARLSEELGYPVTTRAMADRLEALLASDRDVVLVAESDGIVGWVHGAERLLLETGPRCEVLGLVVTEPHRDRGYGRRLVTAVEGWAVGRGLSGMRVRSNVVRDASHVFYRSPGYRHSKTQHCYAKSLGAPEAFRSS